MYIISLKTYQLLPNLTKVHFTVGFHRKGKIDTLSKDVYKLWINDTHDELLDTFISHLEYVCTYIFKMATEKVKLFSNMPEFIHPAHWLEYYLLPTSQI